MHTYKEVKDLNLEFLNSNSKQKAREIQKNFDKKKK